MTLSRKEKIVLAAAGLFMVLWNAMSWRFPFFWDNIAYGRIATWYLDTGFTSLAVTDKLDAGHPPGFNLYLAGVWKIFGRSMTVAHLSMLPFMLGNVWMVFRTARRFMHADLALLTLPLVFLQPVFLSQFTMVTSDIPLVFFFLLTLHLLWDKRTAWAALSVIPVSMLTLRGIMILPAVFAVYYLLSDEKRNEKFRTTLLAALPVTVLVIIWLMYHKANTGWYMIAPDETYGLTRKLMDLSGVMRNAWVLVWRAVDHGAIFLWIVIAWVVLFSKTLPWNLPASFRKPLLALILTGGWLYLTFLPLTNAPGHRYFMVMFVFLGITAAASFTFMEAAKRKFAGGILIFGLLSGNFWIYPDHISKGWDSTLAHISWFQVRKDVEEYMTQHQINGDEVCSDFPVLTEGFFDDVELKRWGFRSVVRERMEKCDRVLWTNLVNSFSDEEMEELRSVWHPEFETRNGFVRAVLYRRESPF